MVSVSTDLLSAPPAIPLAGYHVNCWPMRTGEVRGVMRHLRPGPFRQAGSFPPRRFPRENFGSITRRRHNYPCGQFLAALAPARNHGTRCSHPRPFMPVGESRAAIPVCPRLRSASPPPDFAATTNPRALWQRSTYEENSRPRWSRLTRKHGAHQLR